MGPLGRGFGYGHLPFLDPATGGFVVCTCANGTAGFRTDPTTPALPTFSASHPRLHRLGCLASAREREGEMTGWIDRQRVVAALHAGRSAARQGGLLSAFSVGSILSFASLWSMGSTGSLLSVASAGTLLNRPLADRPALLG